VPFADLLGVGLMRNPKGSDQLHIAIRGGMIICNEHFRNFHQLQAELRHIALFTPAPPLRHTVLFQWIVLLIVSVIVAIVLALAVILKWV
jgi:hypothetical protein